MRIHEGVMRTEWGLVTSSILSACVDLWLKGKRKVSVLELSQDLGEPVENIENSLRMLHRDGILNFDPDVDFGEISSFVLLELSFTCQPLAMRLPEPTSVKVEYIEEMVHPIYGKGYLVPDCVEFADNPTMTETYSVALTYGGDKVSLSPGEKYLEELVGDDVVRGVILRDTPFGVYAFRVADYPYQQERADEITIVPNKKVCPECNGKGIEYDPFAEVGTDSPCLKCKATGIVPVDAADHPTEIDVSDSMAAISEKNDVPPGTTAIIPEKEAALLRVDYSAGQTITVDGEEWIFSLMKWSEMRDHLSVGRMGEPSRTTYVDKGVTRNGIRDAIRKMLGTTVKPTKRKKTSDKMES